MKKLTAKRIAQMEETAAIYVYERALSGKVAVVVNLGDRVTYTQEFLTRCDALRDALRVQPMYPSLQVISCYMEESKYEVVG